MLNHFVNPVTVSIGQSIDGVQAVQAYTPYSQLNQLLPTFHLPDEGGKADDENKEQQHIQLQKRVSEDESELPDIFKLAVNVSFRELFQFFFTPNHDQILDVRHKIYKAVNDQGLTIFIPKGESPERIEVLRKHLYEIQVQFFQSQKGLHCHMVLFENG